MKYRPLIHFNNDEEIVGREYSTFETLDELRILGKDIDYDPEDVQFWQVEPIA